MSSTTVREILQVSHHTQDRTACPNKYVLVFHTQAEKEQKRIKRITRVLKALEANDEEAYVRSVDATKDTRITQLLRQRDDYLESLALSELRKTMDGITTTLISREVLSAGYLWSASLT